MITNEIDLSAYIRRTSKSFDAAVFIGGSLLQDRYDDLVNAAHRGVHIRFLLANPSIGWIDELIRPAGVDPQEYAQRIHISASRALMIGEQVDVRWQPFPIPWWFAISDNKRVYLKSIDLAGRGPATEIADIYEVRYFQNLFASAWERAKSAVPALSSSIDDFQNQPALRVFLCHCSEDKPKVHNLYQRLVAEGVTPWIDSENLVPGQNWELEISRAIKKSDVILICLSGNTVKKRGFIQREIRVALREAEEMPNGSIFLIPVRLEPCEVPDYLCHLQRVDLFDPKGFNLLSRALRIARQR